MSKLIRIVNLELNKIILFFPNILRYSREYLTFFNLNQADGRFDLSFSNQYPCLTDWVATTPFEPHYIYHPAWAARIVAKIKPKKHIDISSTLHFCTMLSAFIPVEFYDFRPANLKLSNLAAKRGDLLKLPFNTGSVKSISCLHTIEHIGLGRYGDKLDPQGDLKALNELKRVTAKGGSLILVVPLGKPALRFNAHRIYSYDQIVSYMDGFDLQEFSLLPDKWQQGLVTNANKKLADKQLWGCGCF